MFQSSIFQPHFDKSKPVTIADIFLYSNNARIIIFKGKSFGKDIE